MLVSLNFLQQSMAFKILRTRLKTVPVYALMHVSSNSTSEFPGLVVRRSPSSSSYAQIQQITEDGEASSDLSNGDFQAKLQHFRAVQNQHQEHRLSHQNLRLRKTLPESAQVEI